MIIKFFKSFDYPNLIFFVLSIIWFSVTFGLEGFVALMFFWLSIKGIKLVVNKHVKEANQAFIRYILYLIVGVIIAFTYIIMNSQAM
ncbi:hypothetical protein EV195_101178 [Tenacibaculum skagerrakense]|uniref:Uncharacterized protein n=1 Tax=Tenacibaculum skagerrakense TaxID=186571 RepID=A0A4R2P074_9FLAO|nr:hypothetical protein EV195_101178 [Tenacibaculum skagerrakense]